MDPATKRNLAGSQPDLTIERQCELLGLSVSGYYYKPAVASPVRLARDEAAMAAIDRWNTAMPYLGARKLAAKLAGEGIATNRKEVRRFMARMGIYAVYPKPNLSRPGAANARFPYLLRGKDIFLPNQVWAIDITYIKMLHAHMYLTAIIDWFSRFIVGWAISDTLDAAPVLQAVEGALLRHGIPGIINSDQGSQFTSDEYVKLLKGHGIRQSMDGKARWVDNVVIERWFRSLKCENIYINEYESPKALRRGIDLYVDEYNRVRPHQSFGNATPADVYHSRFPLG